nr:MULTISPECIES: SDR family oxidoreductase [Rhizobium/Agrobacterium group]
MRIENRAYDATARAAARSGARVALLARRTDRIEALAQELGEALALTCDVTQPKDVRHAVQAQSKDLAGLTPW